MDWTLGDLFDILSKWVFVCSMLSIVLPPVEFFEKYPKFQDGYRLFCKLLKYFGALDFRGKIISQYPQYQKMLEEREKKHL